MTTPEVCVPEARTEIKVHSVLFLLAILASPLMLVEASLSGFQPHAGTDRLSGAIGLAYLLGWLCSLIGMHWSGATGRGTAGRAILAVQEALVLTAAGWSASHVLFPHGPPQGRLCAAFGLAWPLGHLFMLLTGIATLRARAWQDWTRFTPLPGLPAAHHERGVVRDRDVDRVLRMDRGRVPAPRLGGADEPRAVKAALTKVSGETLQRMGSLLRK
jgi:hypothetical protein